ncbi:MAG: hypothetical protein QN163_10085 [Armatimonadota bacterium]|nr:hypothetical protein [Armatimonadota bacterium]MDR5697701.1 hypothetical protein [Armatimonadota bacterium]
MAQRIETRRRQIEEILTSLGRDDLGVGEVEDLGEGRLRVTFLHGHFRHAAELDAGKLDDPQQAKAALMIAVRKLSKDIEAEHIGKAQQ